MKALNLFLKRFSAVIFLNTICFYAWTTNYNVSTTNDLKNALSNAVAGDLILIASGTYTTSPTTQSFPTGDGGTVNRSFDFRGVNNGYIFQ